MTKNITGWSQDDKGRWYNADGDRVCGAKTRDGGRCGQTMVMDNGRCRMHGGGAARGLAAPAFKHGGYSQYMPVKLIERYKEAELDPDLTNLRRDLALIDARLRDRLQALDGGLPAVTISELRAVKAQMVAAQRGGKFEDAQNLADRIMSMIDAGAEDEKVWHEIKSLIKERARLIEYLRRQLETMHTVITADKALAFAGAILDIIRRNVTDQDTLKQISDEITALLV